MGGVTGETPVWPEFRNNSVDYDRPLTDPPFHFLEPNNDLASKKTLSIVDDEKPLEPFDSELVEVYGVIIKALAGVGITESLAREAIDSMRKEGLIFLKLKDKEVEVKSQYIQEQVI